MNSTVIIEIDKATLRNKKYRDIIYTSQYQQLAFMNIKPMGETEEEIHNGDQFIKVVKGFGFFIEFSDDEYEPTQISEGDVIFIPAGTYHQIVNSSEEENLQLYTIYSPPEH